MRPPCMLNVVLFTPCVLAHLLACVCLQKCQQQNDRKISPRTIWKLLAERCLESYCSFVSTFCFDALWNFSASLPRNGTLLFNVVRLLWAYRIDVDVVAHRCFSGRATSSWALLFTADHQLDDFQEFREASTEAAGSYHCLIWSGRTVSSDLGWLLNADTPSGQFIALLVIVRRRSQSLSIHAGRSCFVVNIRLTARLHSLPLARCWPACFAFFSSFPLLFRLILTVVKWLIVGIFRTIIIQKNPTYCVSGACLLKYYNCFDTLYILM